MKQNVLIIGFGVSGKSSAAFLLKKGCRVTAVDKKAAELQMDGIKVYPDRADFPIDDFDLAVVSPGIPQTHLLVQKLRAKGIEVVGEIELAFRFIENRCIGITGTNGKTTTVLLTTHILNSAGKKARALGNVGASLTGYLLESDPEEILVVELSSFQLETLQAKKLEAAAILNLTPNHLDRHPTMDDYVKAKTHIQDCLKTGGKLFYSQQVFREFGAQLKKGEIFDPLIDYAPWQEEENIALIPKLRYTQLGVPERQNVQAAYSFCSYFGVTKSEFRRGLQTFRKPPHRIEWVADIDGVSYYNDSKSSNVDSVLHAVRLFDGPVVLLIGGVHKGSSYLPWIEAFRGKVKKVVAFGQAAPIMEQELASHFPFQKVGTLEEAVGRAKAEAKENETVLLSPGCSSYDQFRNYEHRGEEFKRMVKEKENR